MKVGAVSLAGFIREPTPTVFVKLGEVGFVLGVDDVHLLPAADNDVGLQVTERTMYGVAPMKREDGLPEASDLDLTSGLGDFVAYDRFDVGFPGTV